MGPESRGLAQWDHVDSGWSRRPGWQHQLEAVLGQLDRHFHQHVTRGHLEPGDRRSKRIFPESRCDTAH